MHALLRLGEGQEILPLLQADLMVNVDTLLADTQTLLARLQEAESGGAEDDTFFAADPSRSMSLRQPSPEPQPDPSLPASASSSPEESATDEVYEFQVRASPSCLGCTEAWLLLQEVSTSSWGSSCWSRLASARACADNLWCILTDEPLLIRNGLELALQGRVPIGR